MEDLNYNKPTIITKRNVDEKGNPLSVKMSEIKQVMDSHYVIVLDQLPNEQYRVQIDGFNEAFDMEDLTDSTFYVNYAHGYIHFTPKNVGRMLIVHYYGIGIELISATRVFTELDKYGNPITYIGEEINHINKQLEHQQHQVDSYGEVVSNIETADRLIRQFNNDRIAVEQINPSLNQHITDGRLIDANLVNHIANAQADITAINATGNQLFHITSDLWVKNVNTEFYECNLKHNLNSKSLMIESYNSLGKETFIAYDVIDLNNIKLITGDNEESWVVLNAKYYKPAISGVLNPDGSGGSLSANIGDLNALKTLSKDSVVSAINEIREDSIRMLGGIGDITQLQTERRTDLINAINSIYQTSQNNKQNVGDIRNLSRDLSNRSSLVESMNEMITRIIKVESGMSGGGNTGGNILSTDFGTF